MKRLLALLLTTISLAGGDVKLGWTASPTVDATIAYNLYLAQGGSGTFNLYGTTTNLTMTVTNLSPGLYKFYATATNMWGESIPSNTVQTPSGRPIAVTIFIIP